MSLADAPYLLLPDLASRALGGSVVSANDESFADKENLVRPEPPVFDPNTYGHKGKVYDGWETRRRREPGHDWAVVRLGAPGAVHGVVIDTAHFLGNFPPEASLEGARLPGHPSVAELAAARWVPLVARSPLQGGRENQFAVADRSVWTHVRLSIHPDGGVARLRVHGEALPEPDLLGALGTVDLVAGELGGRVVACSDLFYGSPADLLLPGPPRSMGEGWETSRRRDGGNDWVVVRLGCPGVPRVVELDTSYYLHNAPGEALLRGASLADGRTAPADAEGWGTLLCRTWLQPDTRHRFVLPAPQDPVTHVRLDVFPDGGMGRLRLWGTPTPEGLDALRGRWRQEPADGAPHEGKEQA